MDNLGNLHNKLVSVYKSAITFISSNSFFVLVICIFTLQAMWIALSVTYPLVFDEYYHLGIIDIYGQQFSPFISSQSPEQVSLYRDLTDYPAYLFHYLMSFPYRLINVLTNSFYIQVVTLRFLNVFMVAAGLVAFKRLLRRIHFSDANSNIAILVATLIPIFPFVAAHINYDNMLFLLTPIFLLYGVNILNKEHLSTYDLSIFISIGVAASLAKYSFLPILTAGSLFITIYLLRKHRLNIFSLLKKSYLSEGKYTQTLIVILLVLSLGLFAERFIGNLIKYGDVRSSCAVVHSEEDCAKNGIWQRGVKARKNYEENTPPIKNVLDYTSDIWIPSMVKGSLSAAANIDNPEKIHIIEHENTGLVQPLPLLKIAFQLFVLSSFIFIVYSWREISKLTFFWFFFSIVFLYWISIWLLTNYNGYSQHGNAYAIQPRYFLLLLPLILAYIIKATNIAVSRRYTKLILLAFVLISFTQGGGAITYIVRSNSDWYWDRAHIHEVNLKAKQIIHPLVKE